MSSDGIERRCFTVEIGFPKRVNTEWVEATTLEMDEAMEQLCADGVLLGASASANLNAPSFELDFIAEAIREAEAYAAVMAMAEQISGFTFSRETGVKQDLVELDRPLPAGV